MFQQEKDKLLLELMKTRGVALTSDAWTSRATESYITITCHYILNCELKSKVLQTENFSGSHTGQNVGMELKSAMEKWGIKDKVQVITVDNASNMGIAIQVSGADMKLGCFAHTLNLASNKALDIPSLRNTLGKVRSVVAFFHKSNIATELLKKNQSGLGLAKHRLIIDCKTRWNSTYEMLKRFLEQRPAVLATLLDDSIKQNARAKAVSGMTDSEISTCEEFVLHMKVMLDITTWMCSEKNSTAGLILVFLQKLKQLFTPDQNDSSFVKSLKAAINNNLSGRYTEQHVIKFLEEASVFDPRMKKNTCIPTEAWVRVTEQVTGLMLCATTVNIKQEKDESGPSVPLPALPALPDENNVVEHVFLPSVPSKSPTPSPEKKKQKSVLADLFDDDVVVTAETAPLSVAEQAEREVNFYREVPSLKMDDNPLNVWKENSFRFPNLAILAEKYMCVQATSVASERGFSTTGDIVSATRACLKTDQVDALVFLKKNMEFSFNK